MPETPNRTPRFNEKLSLLRSVDSLCADAVEGEIARASQTLHPRTGYMKGDIRGIKIQDLEGKLIATALVILRENDITFFDLIIEESPEEYRGAD